MTTARIQNQHSPGRQQSLNTSLCTSETQECIDVDSITSVVLFACRFLRASTKCQDPQFPFQCSVLLARQRGSNPVTFSHTCVLLKACVSFSVLVAWTVLSCFCNTPDGSCVYMTFSPWLSWQCIGFLSIISIVRP